MKKIHAYFLSAACLMAAQQTEEAIQDRVRQRVLSLDQPVPFYSLDMVDRDFPEYLDNWDIPTAELFPHLMASLPGAAVKLNERGHLSLNFSRAHLERLLKNHGGAIRVAIQQRRSLFMREKREMIEGERKVRQRIEMREMRERMEKINCNE